MNNEHTPGHPAFAEAHGGKAIPLGRREGLIDLTVTFNGTTTRLDPPVFSTTNKADIVTGLPAKGRGPLSERLHPPLFDDTADNGDGFIARARRHRRATENGSL